MQIVVLGPIDQAMVVSYRNPIFRKTLPAPRLAASIPDARNGLGSAEFHQP